MSAQPSSEHALLIPDAPIWRLSVVQYHHMIESGILTDDDPVELLEGWLVTKMPKSRRHSLVTQLTREALANAVPDGWFVDAQEPITTADSEPEPDVMVVRGQRRDYAERHPAPPHIALVVEVSDATLQRDQSLKLRLYAAAGIPVYWIMNLPEQRLEVYTDPSEGSYRHHQNYAPGDVVPLILEGTEVAAVPLKDMLA
jgi:Uma2 family endonuclease